MLELKNICFSADGKQILKDINLRIDDEIHRNHRPQRQR